MKKNLPITDKEVILSEQDVIITTTDLKGLLTYFNKTFMKINGFNEQELLGKNHNIIRHPDVPAEVFKELWDQVKAGKTWQGVLKNRCKSGDHYWVEAFVTPIIVNKQITGYQSVRSSPTRQQIERAEATYDLHNKP